MLQFEDQLAVIFIACDEYKSKPIAAYRTNIKCGNFSSTSSGKRRTDEESSRQVRQKSSEVHMPQSSQDGMTCLDNHKVCSFFFNSTICCWIGRLRPRLVAGGFKSSDWICLDSNSAILFFSSPDSVGMHCV